MCVPTGSWSEDATTEIARAGYVQVGAASTHQPVSDHQQLVLSLHSVADVLPVG